MSAGKPPQAGADRLAALDPAATALLVIDMQNAFAHPGGTLGESGVDLGEADAVTAAVRDLVDAAGAWMPVIWTKQVHLWPDRGREAKRLSPHTSKRTRVAALDGTWDAALRDEFAAYDDGGADVVVKHRFGAFYATRLDALLRMRGVRTLIIVGATANACVDTTIREAYMRDFDIVVPLDAVIAVDPEWKRLAAATWNHYFAAVTDTATVLGWLRHTPRHHPGGAES
ncbi:cysteine hydrolase family protein [Dactylosporangium sp. CA-233914]|uniref:cysteine hydrolase family protein n=1 Tax=Dactylosporangium sp. CA-233914 TaxID=3239934 RepID=UPI003D8A53BC